MSQSSYKWGAVFLALLWVFGLTPKASAYEAQHVPGCISKVQDRGDTFVENLYYTEIIPDPGFPLRFVDVRVSALLMYWYCPNGLNANKVKAKWISWCWTQTGRQEHLYFAGVKFNAYIYDSSGANVNPPAFTVGDDNTIQNCGTQDIPRASEAWQFMDHEPRWKANATIRLHLLPDSEWQFENASGGTVNYIIPANGTILSGWHN